MKSGKIKTQFACSNSNCGFISPKWQGQCPSCQQWNCLVEEVISTKEPFVDIVVKKQKNTPIVLSQELSSETGRTSTGMKELDRVLGGGIVPGAYILLGGAPGIGKSTLLLQMCEGLSNQSNNQDKRKVLYVSAEESLSQTSLRAKRLHLKNQNNIFIFNETSLENIFHSIRDIKANVLIIDSIQTISFSDLTASPGTISQVRECANQLMHFAKTTGIAVFVIGHITKDGQLAGPRLLEHMVDTVLSFEGDPHYPFRILRALKNRFGAVNEIGVFQMGSQGLKEVSNPSEFFLEEKKENCIGSAVLSTMEGSRPLLCEAQALSLRSYLSMPRRNSIGLDIQRLHMIIAVLDRHLKLGLSQCDIFLNLVGGMKVTEPGADLAIAKALISSKKQEPIDKLSCFFGEIGLTGEVRACTFAEERIKEAQQLGFEKVYLPTGNKKHLKNSLFSSLTPYWISSVQELSVI